MAQTNHADRAQQAVYDLAFTYPEEYMQHKYVTVQQMEAWLSNRFEEYLFNCGLDGLAEIAEHLSPWFEVKCHEDDPRGFVVSYDDDPDDGDFEDFPDYKKSKT